MSPSIQAQRDFLQFTRLPVAEDYFTALLDYLHLSTVSIRRGDNHFF
jgi:hypothetical protein